MEALQAVFLSLILLYCRL